MIILFEENETDFSTLGIGVLSDTLSCKVTETLNDSFELELTYPIDGKNFSKIEINRIISSKYSPYSNYQPFRIYSISKPIDGKITVNAAHISYDMNGIAVNPINGYNIRDTLEKIQNGTLLDSNFRFYTDMTSNTSYKTTAPYNMRAILMGSDGSILDKYKCEVQFDRFEVHLMSERGTNRGIQIRYAKNMTSLKHDISYDNLYNGVYPYYHSESSQISTSTSDNDFKQVYIVGKKPYQDGWLSYTENGEPYHPVDASPVQIATDGDYYEKVYCWNNTTRRYDEKIYNQTITLIEGVVEPDWIYIDWTKFPSVVCKAGKAGYFKTSTDTEWVSKQKDDIIFEGSILKVDQLASNIMLYYSEVIPTTSASSNEETSVTHVELKDKIMWLDTPEAKAMKHNRILMLDLTSEFSSNSSSDDSSDTTTTSSETGIPTEEELEKKAKEYIEKNKIGKLKFDTDVSFVDLSTVINEKNDKTVEKIELGDIVKVIYGELGVDIDLRVITTEYNPLLDQYTKITLGEKSDKISSSSVQVGDNVSSLTNDVGYADITTVNKLIAKTITADYIQAQNAKLSAAQIAELQTARIKCTGILEATQLELDRLVAKLLIADNAEIAQQLSAGTVKVAGDITVNSGSISISNGQKVFEVSKDGDLSANSVNITGGSLRIADTFEVSNDGLLSATGADIQGTIKSSNGEIGGFTITDTSLYNRISSFSDDSYLGSGVYIGTDGIKLGSNFSVDSSGNIIAKSGSIGGANIKNGILQVGEANVNSININNLFVVEEDGTTIIQNGKSGSEERSMKMDPAKGTLNIKGTISATDGEIGSFVISGDSLYNGTIQSFTEKYEDTAEGVFLGIDGIRIGNNLTINSEGVLKSGETTSDTNTGIDSAGKLTATSAEISGNITALSGYIGNPQGNGFAISSKAIEYGYTSKTPDVGDDPNSNVVYIGTDAIRLGKNPTNFIHYPDNSTGGLTISTNNTEYINIPSANTNPGKSWHNKKLRISFSNISSYTYLTLGFGRILTIGEGADKKETPSIYGTDWIYPAVLGHTDEEKISQAQQEYDHPDSNHIVNGYQYIPVLPNSNYLDITLNYPRVGDIVTKLKFDLDDPTKVIGVTDVVVGKESDNWDIDITVLAVTNMTIEGVARQTFHALYIDNQQLDGFYINQNGDLTASNAKIIGSFQGDVNIVGGSISIQNFEGDQSFSVTKDGLVSIIGGSIGIMNNGETVFEVTNTGELTATIGTIAGFNINKDGFYKGDYSNISPDAILFSSGYKTDKDVGGSTYRDPLSKTWSLIISNTFGITKGGVIYTNELKLGDLILYNSSNRQSNVIQVFNKNDELHKSSALINMNSWSYNKDEQSYYPTEEDVCIWGRSSLFESLYTRRQSKYISGKTYNYFSVVNDKGLISQETTNTSNMFIGRLPQYNYSLVPFFLSRINGMKSLAGEESLDNHPEVHNPIFVLTEHEYESGAYGTMTIEKPNDPVNNLTLTKLVYANVFSTVSSTGTSYENSAGVRPLSGSDTSCIIWSKTRQKIYLFRIFI